MANMVGIPAWDSNFFVCDVISPGGSQKLSETAQRKSVQLSFSTRVKCLCFTSIEKGADHTGLIHLHLGTQHQHGIVHTLFARPTLAVDAFPIRIFSSLSKEKLLIKFDP